MFIFSNRFFYPKKQQKTMTDFNIVLENEKKRSDVKEVRRIA